MQARLLILVWSYEGENNMRRYFLNSEGYIALMTLLIVAALGLTIGITISLRGVEELQLSYGTQQARAARVVTVSCVEESLERLRNNFVSHTFTLQVGADSCILQTSVSGSSATIRATSTVDVFTQHIEVTLDSDRNITDWKEF